MVLHWDTPKGCRPLCYEMWILSYFLGPVVSRYFRWSYFAPTSLRLSTKTVSPLVMLIRKSFTYRYRINKQKIRLAKKRINQGRRMAKEIANSIPVIATRPWLYKPQIKNPSSFLAPTTLFCGHETKMLPLTPTLDRDIRLWKDGAGNLMRKYWRK